jgi:HK97 family phage major capsid protein
MASLDRTIELTKLIQSRMSECEAMKSKAQAEDRHLNDEERKRFGEFMKDIGIYTEELELEKMEVVARERLAKPMVDGVRPNIDPKLDELQERFPGLPAKDDRFATFGDALVAARFATDPSRGIDRKLRAPAGMSEGSPSDGGFALQMDYASDIKKRMFSTGQILPRLTRLPISGNSNSITIPAAADDTESAGVFGGIIAYWLSEAGTKSTSSPKFREMVLKLKKLAVVVPTTDELLNDKVTLEAFIRTGSNLALVKEAEKQVIRGVGAGQPLGVLNSGALVTVSAETGQLADTIEYANIVNMWSRMYADSRTNAIWLINQSIEPQLYTMGITVGVGGSPVYQPPGGASASPYGTLFGRPVVPCNHCSTLGDKGDIILADFGEYLWIEKGGVQEATSIHYAFITDETYYRFVMRCDGQPAWSKVFTPEQATAATQSPFVTLAARA